VGFPFRIFYWTGELFYGSYGGMRHATIKA
jgi:hypothetical protein